MKLIDKITFNVNINGHWYNRVNVGISANNGFTSDDIDTNDGCSFSMFIGNDNYDAHVYRHKTKDEYKVKLKRFERNKKGEWVKSKEQPYIRVNNVKIKFCDNILN